MEAHWAVWHHHIEVSPFMSPGSGGGGSQVMLGAQQMQYMMRGVQPQPLPVPTRGPEGMQVDPTSVPASASSAASASVAHVATASHAAASADAPMGEQSAGGARTTRSHTEAPMRKLSVNLIDTYKLINQVRATGVQGVEPAWGLG